MHCSLSSIVLVFFACSQLLVVFNMPWPSGLSESTGAAALQGLCSMASFCSHIARLLALCVPRGRSGVTHTCVP